MERRHHPLPIVFQPPLLEVVNSITTYDFTLAWSLAASARKDAIHQARLATSDLLRRAFWAFQYYQPPALAAPRIHGFQAQHRDIGMLDQICLHQQTKT